MQSCLQLSWPRESNFSEIDEVEDKTSGISDVLTTHVLNLKQLWVEQQLQDWLAGVAELREFLVENSSLAGLLVAVLVELVKTHESDIEFFVQGK